jgi:hypothetical protein
MGQIIFKNSKTLSTKDIFVQLLIGLGILLLVGLLSPIRDKGQTSWTIFFVLSTLIVIAWTIKALTEKTLKLVDVQNTEVRFVINRQLKNDQTFNFQLKGLSLEITTKPDRLIPPNKILTIKDNNSLLTISSRQKGLSEKSLTEIVKRIKHYPQQEL